jgi:hypothetical protein
MNFLSCLVMSESFLGYLRTFSYLYWLKIPSNCRTTLEWNRFGRGRGMF